jgi:hypothetical protein
MSRPKPKSCWNSRAVLWPCEDCGCDVAPVIKGWRMQWLAKDTLWNKGGARHFLCVACLETRLGRPLKWGVDIFPTGRLRVSRQQWRRWIRYRHTWQQSL